MENGKLKMENEVQNLKTNAPRFTFYINQDVKGFNFPFYILHFQLQNLRFCIRAYSSAG